MSEKVEVMDNVRSNDGDEKASYSFLCHGRI